MPDLILHHYAMLPFSEKIRTVLGFKQLELAHFSRAGYALKLEVSS